MSVLRENAGIGAARRSGSCLTGSGHYAGSDAMSMTNRYFTSLLSIRS